MAAPPIPTVREDGLAPKGLPCELQKFGLIKRRSLLKQITV
ncbi:hypothetical protein [Phormidesmis priestleyi]